MSARTGRPWLSALQSVVSSIGLITTLVMTSPPVIAACWPNRVPWTGTVFRKWTKSWVWLAADVDVVDAVEGRAGREQQLAPVAGGRVRCHPTATVTVWVAWVSTRV